MAEFVKADGKDLLHFALGRQVPEAGTKLSFFASSCIAGWKLVG